MVSTNNHLSESSYARLPMGTRLPHHPMAEQSLLGTLMSYPDSWDSVADQLEEKDFYGKAHQEIFSVVRTLHQKGSIVDVVTVSELLQSSGLLDQVGGQDYLLKLVQECMGPGSLETYVEMVRSKSLLRQLIQRSQEIVQRCYTESFSNMDSFMDEVEARIFEVGKQRNAGSLSSISQIVEETSKNIDALFKRGESITGLATGFKGLDEKTLGLQKGELIIIAARPSMGKTAFSLNLVQKMCVEQKKKVAYFSLEMGEESVAQRLLSSMAQIPFLQIRNGTFRSDAWPELTRQMGRLGESFLYIDDSTSVSPFEIRSRCRRQKATKGLDLVVIDYLQLMKLPHKVESREREVSEMSRQLKALARELDVPVVALAQLNRSVESRQDYGKGKGRPFLSDLRESGSIEQDADLIILLYRAGYYYPDDMEKQNNATVIIGKQRNGPIGDVELFWDPRYGQFLNLPEASPERSLFHSSRKETVNHALE